MSRNLRIEPNDNELSLEANGVLSKMLNNPDTDYASGLSANTIKHYHANIHKALKYAVKMDLITVNESEKTERPKMEKFEAMFYNEHELGLLFNAFRGDRMEIVVLIAAYYGLRRSEIIGLRWDAIDFEKGTISQANMV